MKAVNIFTLAFAISLTAFTSCTNSKSGEEGQSAVAARKTEKEMVRVMPLAKEEIARSVEYSSTLEPFEEVHLASSSPGRIEAINVEIGDNVKKGQTLVLMNGTQLMQSKIQLKNLEADMARLDTLKLSGSIAQQQYDQLSAQYEVAKANYEFLSENTVLTAPFSGVVSGKYFEAGEMYSGSPVAAVGKAAILSIVQIDQLKTIVSVSEKYFPYIKKGMEAKVKLDVYPETEFTGKILRIYPVIKSESHSFDIEVSVANKGNTLRPGMFSRISIDLDKTEAILLPALAVLKMQGSNNRYLFVEENGIAKRVEVTIGKRFDDKIEVISDELKAGDKVIVTGQARLVDGMAVEVVN